MTVEKIAVGPFSKSLDEKPMQYSNEEISAQLTRILNSPLFAHSARLSRFVSYTVERAVAGKPQDLKEYSIGIEVYDRKPPYHPNEDSIVRTEARRLRTKLKQYYESEGKTDPIQFYYRPGSYVPVFRKVQSIAADRDLAPSRADQTHTRGVTFVVLPFVDVSGTPLASSFARGLTDEVMHCLTRAEGCRVIGYSALRHQGTATLSADNIAPELGAQVALEGTVREDSGRVRVTCNFVSLPGLERWSDRFECHATALSPFELEELVATALVGRFAPRSLKIRRRQRSPEPQEVACFPELLASETLLDRGDKLSIQQALVKFLRIEQAQPACARASCGVAQSFYWLGMLGEPLTTNCAAEALRAANRALAIDPEMIEAHAARGCALMLDHDWPGAESSFTHGIRLGAHAVAYRLYGDLLTSRGRFDEAFQILEYAQNLDPFSYRQKVSYSRFFYLSRRFEDGMEYRAAITKFGPVPPQVLVFDALTYIALGKAAQASEIAAAMVRRAASSLPILADACGIFSASGERPRAESLCKSHRLLDARTPLTAVRKALLALALDDHRRAEFFLKEAFQVGEAEVCWVGVDPRCDRIAGTSFVSSLLGERSRRSGLPAPHGDVAALD